MWSHNFVATSSGPGIADLPWVAVRPISLAYSGDMVATVPVPRVAMCQMPIKARNSAIETIAARKRSQEVVPHDPPPRRPSQPQHPAPPPLLDAPATHP